MERTRNIQQFSGVEAVAASEDVVCPDWFPHAAFMLLIQHELGCSANQEPQSSGQWADLMGDTENRWNVFLNAICQCARATSWEKGLASFMAVLLSRIFNRKNTITVYFSFFFYLKYKYKI